MRTAHKPAHSTKQRVQWELERGGPCLLYDLTTGLKLPLTEIREALAELKEAGVADHRTDGYGRILWRMTI